MIAKVQAARSRGTVVDGHAPGVTGRDLMAYAAAGIRSDHESTDPQEAAAKAAAGMLIQVREGSSARNLEALLPLMAGDRLGDWCLCTDDIHPDDLMAHGHLDGLLRRVVAGGVDPAQAVRHATLVPARHYGLHDRGAVAPGRRADLLVVDDLSTFGPLVVIKDGRIVARDGVYLPGPSGRKIPPENTVHLADLDETAFVLRIG
ncbi:MAG: amidohydrolase family protein, partial [Planctomycetota bacterium]